MARAAIAMAAVRRGMRGPPGRVFGSFKLVRPRTPRSGAPTPRQLSRDAVPTLPHTLKYRLELLIAERAVPEEEAGDLTVEGFLAGMLDRIALLTDGELRGIR